MISSYRDLVLWKKSIDLVVAVYKITEKFPREEIYGLTNQMRRAAVSIPSNIAEGYCRGYRKEYIQFLQIAFASGAELETQLLIAQKLNFINTKQIEVIEMLLTEIMKMSNKLITVLKSH